MTVFQIVIIAFQVITLLTILFGAGVYIGRTNALLNALTTSQLEIKAAMAEHACEDAAQFVKIADKLTEIQVELAKKHD